MLATQRPSVNVVTGLIKTNVPSRLAFATYSLIDSRVILDQPGAEKLIGMGDGLYLLMGHPGRSGSRRVRQRCGDLRCRGVRQVAGCARLNEGVTAKADANKDVDPDIGNDLDLLIEAINLVVTSQLGSASMLQRNLRVGLAKSGRLIDLMETLGIVGPFEGSKTREVLIRTDEIYEVIMALTGATSPRAG